MSRPNLELQSLMVAAANARRVPGDILSPEFRMEHHASAVIDHTYRGETGWRDWLNDLFEDFTGEVRFRIENTIEAAEDFVVTIVCVSGRTVRTGTPLDFRWANVTWFADGCATRSIGYTTVEEALRAAHSSHDPVFEAVPRRAAQPHGGPVT